MIGGEGAADPYPQQFVLLVVQPLFAAAVVARTACSRVTGVVGDEVGVGKIGCPLGDGVGSGPGVGVAVGVGCGNGGSVGEPTAAAISCAPLVISSAASVSSGIPFASWVVALAKSLDASANPVAPSATPAVPSANALFPSATP